ncbi:MAG: AsmA family protein, partial [Alphaproteobacteria bacterium]|nr:AsmA family protein [Alphaproteobacteria bacterium]
GVSLEKVELSAPPAMSAGPTLIAGRIDVSVALLPLLSRAVRVEHVALVRPVIDLSVDGQGRRSWDFASSAQAPVRLAAAAGGRFGAAAVADTSGGVIQLASVTMASTMASGAAASLIDKIELRSIAMMNADIRYRDARSGAAHRVSNLDLRLNGGRLSEPLKARGGLTWRGEQLTFDADLDTLTKILDGESAEIRATVSGGPLAAGFDGTVKLAGTIEAAGQARVEAASLAAATAWLGVEFPNAAPLGGFNASGRLVANAKSIALNGANLSLGPTRASGTLQLSFRDKRPHLGADLKLTELDIDRLSAGLVGGRSVPLSNPAPAAQRQPTANASEQSVDTAGTPRSIEDLLHRSGQPDSASRIGRFAPQVRGYTSRNEWSADPIDVSALSLLDADAKLRVDGMRVGGLSIAQSVLRVALANAAARVDIDDIQLYDGAGKGVLTMQPSTGGIGMAANIRIQNVSARPLLKDAADFDRLEGHGDVVVIVTGAGNSQRAIADSLNGDARFSFNNGAIVGWNLAKIMRGVQRGQFTNFDAMATEQTDFSELAASFKLTSGVAVTSDVSMVSPLLRVTGQGSVGIGRRDLDLALRPKLVASMAGQGNREAGTGLEIPVRLTGPWHAPRITPDFAGVASDPGQLLERARQLGGDLKGGSVGDIVRGALGGAAAAPSAGSGARDTAPAEGTRPDLIQQLLR